MAEKKESPCGWGTARVRAHESGLGVRDSGTKVVYHDFRQLSSGFLEFFAVLWFTIAMLTLWASFEAMMGWNAEVYRPGWYWFGVWVTCMGAVVIMVYGGILAAKFIRRRKREMERRGVISAEEICRVLRK